VRIPTAVDAAQLTADPELQEAYLRDRLVGHGISVGLYDAVLDAQARAGSWAPPGDLTALVVLPMADPVVDTATTERWLASAGSHLEVLRLPGARHEPHNDLGRNDLYRVIADWLDARTPDARSG
jgi:alpha-beta hydrolase superfamily lysophospholipase